MNLSTYKLEDFIPKLFFCLKDGASKKYFFNDLLAGISVAVIAIPLNLAFAIGSGVAPERGLFTAIVAGFLIAMLGGSRVLISGPTGAFVVIVYAVIQKHGYEGLALATIIGGILLILMGLLRFGVLLKYIPYPVITGFTTGIAVIIFFSQIKDFFGLQIDKLPPDFLEKCGLYCVKAHTLNNWAFLLGSGTLALIFILRRFPKLPGIIIAISLATLINYFFNLPLETLESKFGALPRVIPTPSLPDFSYAMIKRVFPDAITIALLGAIESLLTAVVADGMTGYKHRSNCELAAQGIGNIGSIIFGGIPATGAIARTTANIKMGAKTPVSAMIQSITLLLLMLFLAPLAGKIPLTALSAVLIFIAWNMSDLPHFFEIIRSEKSEALILLSTFLLTVLIDLTVAVQVGVVLSAVIFLKKMTDHTSVEICQFLAKENENEKPFAKDSELRENVPEDTTVFEINGPFFYSIADLLSETLSKLDKTPAYFILRMQKVPLIDATGIKALKEFVKKCSQNGITFLVSEPSEKLMRTLRKSNLETAIGKEHVFKDLDTALAFAKKKPDIKSGLNHLE